MASEVRSGTPTKEIIDPTARVNTPNGPRPNTPSDKTRSTTVSVAIAIFIGALVGGAVYVAVPHVAVGVAFKARVIYASVSGVVAAIIALAIQLYSTSSEPTEKKSVTPATDPTTRSNVTSDDPALLSVSAKRKKFADAAANS